MINFGESFFICAVKTKSPRAKVSIERERADGPCFSKKQLSLTVRKVLARPREAGLKALEALRNTDDTQFIASDDDDADFLDD
ncbi:hypothetical protein BpHYR1_028545 [Brachionus plicatilis]|uniref:Uncharacterized protein n=1 Tax=Brachionus plicatilis TaxID=10195 RepID=A0A3M7R411_BRAPC|nr:hypothetical protein BpHYR1_028545 [Brachionus plicatilis]